MNSTFPSLDNCGIPQVFFRIVAITKPTKRWRAVTAKTPGERKPEPGGT